MFDDIRCMLYVFCKQRQLILCTCTGIEVMANGKVSDFIYMLNLTLKDDIGIGMPTLKLHANTYMPNMKPLSPLVQKLWPMVFC